MEVIELPLLSPCVSVREYRGRGGGVEIEKI